MKNFARNSPDMSLPTSPYLLHFLQYQICVLDHFSPFCLWESNVNGNAGLFGLPPCRFEQIFDTRCHVFVAASSILHEQS